MSDNTNNTESSSESRRDFIKKAGKFAIYAPPAIMLMSKTGHATIASSGGRGGSGGGGNGGGSNGRRTLRDILNFFFRRFY